jgi:hypothetical protein
MTTRRPGIKITIVEAHADPGEMLAILAAA